MDFRLTSSTGLWGSVGVQMHPMVCNDATPGIHEPFLSSEFLRPITLDVHVSNSLLRHPHTTPNWYPGPEVWLALPSFRCKLPICEDNKLKDGAEAVSINTI